MVAMDLLYQLLLIYQGSRVDTRFITAIVRLSRRRPCCHSSRKGGCNHFITLTHRRRPLIGDRVMRAISALVLLAVAATTLQAQKATRTGRRIMLSRADEIALA